MIAQTTDKMSSQALFHPGQIVATPGALDLAQSGVNLAAYLSRHLAGDWGDLDEFDQQQNNSALANGSRLLSAYNTQAGRLWIITESDRAATTFLTPDEY